MSDEADVRTAVRAGGLLDNTDPMPGSGRSAGVARQSGRCSPADAFQIEDGISGRAAASDGDEDTWRSVRNPLLGIHFVVAVIRCLKPRHSGPFIDHSMWASNGVMGPERISTHGRRPQRVAAWEKGEAHTASKMTTKSGPPAVNADTGFHRLTVSPLPSVTRNVTC